MVFKKTNKHHSTFAPLSFSNIKKFNFAKLQVTPCSKTNSFYSNV